MPTALHADTVIEATAEPVSTSVGGEEVVLHPGTGTYHGLNGVGREIWERIQEPTTPETVTAALTAEYDADVDRVRADVLAFLDDLRDADLLRVDARDQ